MLAAVQRGLAVPDADSPGSNALRDDSRRRLRGPGRAAQNVIFAVCYNLAPGVLRPTQCLVIATQPLHTLEEMSAIPSAASAVREFSPEL